MKFKSEKGFTLIDITVAIIILLLFMSLISVIFFNITKETKGIERDSEATYIATNIIEAFKAKEYNDVFLTNGNANVTNVVGEDNVVQYTGIDGNVKLNIGTIIQDGYTCQVNVSKYTPQGEDPNNDLVKKIRVIVQYKVASEVKDVTLEISIVRK